MTLKNNYNQLKRKSYTIFKIVIPTLIISSFILGESNASDYVEPGQGSRMRIYKQDEISFNGETAVILIPHLVKDGPTSPNAYIAPRNKQVMQTGDGDFLYDPISQSDEFDFVHAVAVADTVVTMYDRDFNFFEETIRVTTNGFRLSYNNWLNRTPLAIFPHDDSSENNAYFIPTSKSGGELHFFPFNSPTKGRVYTSRSFDIVAHETAHAVLHFFRRDFDYSSPQTAALNESFGDLTAIFTILTQPYLRHDLLIQTKGNLHNKSFLPLIAEEFGIALHQGNSLRDADNTLTVQDLDPSKNTLEAWESHSLSRLFTGAIYDILADTFRAQLQQLRGQFEDDMILTDVGNGLRRLLLLSIIETPYSNPTFASIGNMMLSLSTQYDDFKSLSSYIDSNFLKRGIDIQLEQNDLNEQDRFYLASPKAHEPHLCKSLRMKKERTPTFASVTEVVEYYFTTIEIEDEKSRKTQTSYPQYTQTSYDSRQVQEVRKTNKPIKQTFLTSPNRGKFSSTKGHQRNSTTSRR